MRLVAGASSSDGSGRLQSRFRSSHPNHAIRSSTTGDDRVRADTQSAERRSRENPSGCWLAVAAARVSTFDHAFTARRPPARSRAEAEELPRRGASILIEKTQAANSLRALTGEERISSKSPSARDGHRFESPQLHQEVRAN